jgi:hypothetical protein
LAGAARQLKVNPNFMALSPASGWKNGDPARVHKNQFGRTLLNSTVHEVGARAVLRGEPYMLMLEALTRLSRPRTELPQVPRLLRTKTLDEDSDGSPH